MSQMGKGVFGMESVKSGDCILHVHVSGPDNGRVVMFSNSLGSDLRVWDLLVPFLPEGLRIVRYDKRGHGLSTLTPSPYRMETLVEDAEAIIDAFDLRDITFVGLSIGGLIGQGLAHKRPDHIRALVLMDTAAKIGTTEMWRERIDALKAGGIESIADAILDRWFAPNFRNNSFAVEPWRNMLIRTPLEGYIGCCEAILASDYSGTAEELKLPIMAMTGEKDGSTPPELVEATAKLYGAPCHVIADAAHIPCVEQPEKTAELIADFLKETEHV
jgi:3-oxoadipate enol-lactonase